MTFLVIAVLCLLIVGLGVVALSLGLGIRHPVRSAVALTLGSLVILGGSLMFYEALSRRSEEAMVDRTVTSLYKYVDLRAKWLKAHLHPVKKTRSGEVILPSPPTGKPEANSPFPSEERGGCRSLSAAAVRTRALVFERIALT